MRVFDRLRPAFNVTNLEHSGSPVHSFFAGPVSPGVYPPRTVVEGAGLNMTVMSYDGTVYFGLNGCRETVPDMSALPALGRGQPRRTVGRRRTHPPHPCRRPCIRDRGVVPGGPYSRDVAPIGREKQLQAW